MEPFYNKNDEDAKLRRDDSEPGNDWYGSFVNGFLMPGLMGFLGALFLGKFCAGLIRIVTEDQPVARGINKIFSDLSREFGLLAQMQWGQTTLWMYVIVGFVAGILIKFAYQDGDNM
jgi:hypothetical protein